MRWCLLLSHIVLSSSIITLTITSKLEGRVHARTSSNCVPTRMKTAACEEQRRRLRGKLEYTSIKRENKKLRRQKQETTFENETRRRREGREQQSLQIQLGKKTLKTKTKTKKNNEKMLLMLNKKKKASVKLKRQEQVMEEDVLHEVDEETISLPPRIGSSSSNDKNSVSRKNQYVRTHQAVKSKIERRIPENVTAICRAAQVRCAADELCVVNIQNLPVCRCISVASCGRVRPRSFVCATDGNTYLSRCHLTATSCALKTHSPFSIDSKLMLLHQGECSPGQGATLLTKQLQLRIRGDRKGTRKQRRILRAMRRAEKKEGRRQRRRMLKKKLRVTAKRKNSTNSVIIGTEFATGNEASHD